MNKAEVQTLLDQIQRPAGLSQEQRERLSAGVDSPWWLSVLLGLAAWVSSLFLIGSLVGPSLLLRCCFGAFVHCWSSPVLRCC